MNECPGTERITEYLEHKLSAEDTNQVETHLIDCRICRKIIARVIQSESVVPDPIIFPKTCC
jgi:hypothetical protein